MVNIKLKDGSLKQCEKGMTLGAIAKLFLPNKIFANVVAASVNEIFFDLEHKLENDAAVEFITTDSNEGLAILRHSAAHLMAQAVKELFPEAKLGFGPAIEDGFYYDFALENTLTEADLSQIESKMRELVKKNFPLKRKIMERDEALAFFRHLDEIYKIELIAEIPEGELISSYSQNGFIDICRGPHVASTGQIKWFKLTKLAGAYWRGDSKNKMLQRIYGTAWATEQELKDYLFRMEQAKLRDHRLIGKKLDLFHLQEEAPGMVFWHANGWAIYKEIKNYISRRLRDFDYQEVNTPQLIDCSLWEKSGHWDKYSEVMFVTEAENRKYAIKPMNCPGHIQIFKQGLKSYRDLPIRYSEFGSCHRNEYSGTLHGIMRVRGFVQDDGHIFCTEDQIAQEAADYVKQLQMVYVDFGFPEIITKLATRPAKRIGADESWDKAEKALINTLEQAGMQWMLNPGEGAFYGPKIEFSLKDCLGRVWQCGTLQVDFFMPERLGAYYIDEHGEKKVPVMLHRAMLGSLERFLGILLEETTGNLPFWLAPTQITVMNITDNQLEYARSVYLELLEMGFRVKTDLRNEKIGFKIREHSIARVPYLMIIGDKEKDAQLIAVRDRDGKDLGQMSLEAFVKVLEEV